MPPDQSAEEEEAWPANALPKKWIDTLFAKMAAFYGARFADAWRGTKLAHVQRAWAIELAKLSHAEMKGGVEKLVERAFPPTLPEFFALCKQSRPVVDPSHVLFLAAPAPPVDMAKVNATVRKASEALARRTPNGAEWAFQRLTNGKTGSGAALPLGVIEVCKQAIRSPAGSAFMRTTEGQAYRELYQRIQAEYQGATA